MRELINRFIQCVRAGEVEVYNEFSLQHELSLFIRTHSTGYKVEFERNVSHFFRDKALFSKREIDRSAYSAGQEQLRCAIEVKYPRNGQYPEQMFRFCRDLAFAEELKRAGFQETYVLIFADDRPFYKGSTNGIYGYFRGGRELHGTVRKPTGRKDEELQLHGRYHGNWQPILGELRYTCIEATNGEPSGRRPAATGRANVGPRMKEV